MICVHEDFYEDPLDEELNDLVRDGVSVIKTQAAGVLKIGPYRLIGDIGLRGGYHMLKEAWCFLKQDQVWRFGLHDPLQRLTRLQFTGGGMWVRRATSNRVEAVVDSRHMFREARAGA